MHLQLEIKVGFLNWKRKEVWHNSWLCHVIYIVYSTHPTPNSVKYPGPSTTCVTTLQLARFINRPKVNLDTRQSQGESTRINETRAQSMNLGLEQDRLKVQYFPFQMENIANIWVFVDTWIATIGMWSMWTAPCEDHNSWSSFYQLGLLQNSTTLSLRLIEDLQ